MSSFTGDEKTRILGWGVDPFVTIPPAVHHEDLAITVRTYTVVVLFTKNLEDPSEPWKNNLFLCI